MLCRSEVEAHMYAPAEIASRRPGIGGCCNGPFDGTCRDLILRQLANGLQPKPESFLREGKQYHPRGEMGRPSRPGRPIKPWAHPSLPGLVDGWSQRPLDADGAAGGNEA